MAKSGGNRNSLADDDNRKDQMNPNNDAYWQSRGFPERPDDWQSRPDDRSSNGSSVRK